MPKANVFGGAIGISGQSRLPVRSCLEQTFIHPLQLPAWITFFEHIGFGEEFLFSLIIVIEIHLVKVVFVGRFLKEKWSSAKTCSPVTN